MNQLMYKGFINSTVLSITQGVLSVVLFYSGEFFMGVVVGLAVLFSAYDSRQFYKESMKNE